jgi:hypothetical protein
MDNPHQNNNSQNQAFLKQLEGFFDTYLHKKVPLHLPPAVKEFIVKYGPWIMLVLMILAIPALLAAIGLSAAVAPFAMMYGGYHLGAAFILSALIGLLALIMQAVALPGLFARTLKGWHMLYYATLVHALSQLVVGDVIGLIIGLALSMYVLFQVKELYK